MENSNDSWVSEIKTGKKYVYNKINRLLNKNFSNFNDPSLMLGAYKVDGGKTKKRGRFVFEASLQSRTKFVWLLSRSILIFCAGISYNYEIQSIFLVITLFKSEAFL